MRFLLPRHGAKAVGALGAGLALMLGLTAAPAAQAEPRVALVIGNSAYQGDLPALPNPANDARLMAKTLKSVGFDVVEAEDASQDDMKKAIAAFSEKLAAAGTEGTGLFFYAGHGVQVAGENYLIPVDARIKREAEVDLAAVSASTVLKQMEFADSAVNIIILDACRNNPLGDGARGLSRGLAEIKTTPRGSFIAYSTAPGSTAADGDGVNSPYTKALAETITEPGLSISDVFQEVRTKVLASTGNQQTPWDSSSLTGRFYFTAPPTTTVAAAAPSAADAALKTEKTYWDSVKDSGDPEAIQLYLTKYPNGYFVDLANAKLEELKGGTKVASTDTRSGSAAPQPQPQPQADSTAKPTQPAVAFIAQSQTVYAKGGGQVRAAPNGSADLLAKLPTNTEVTATGVSTDGKWWRVAMADGRTGFMHKSVVAEQAAQVASAAPTQPAAVPPAQTRTLDTDESAFQTMGGPAPAPEPQQNNDMAQQLLQAGLQQLGLPNVNIPQPQTQPAQPVETATFSLQPMNGVVQVKEGAQIFEQPGGRLMYMLRKTGPMLASARTSDGRWFQVALPNAQIGYVAQQSVTK